MSQILTGPALVMGDNVNTDVLHPSRFFSLDDSTVRSGFMQATTDYQQTGRSDLSGKIILAGDNFGCGSSRETGARVFVLAGIRAIVARSIARIFSRNIRNLGVPAFECPTLPAKLENGSIVHIDPEAWTLEIDSAPGVRPLKPLDPYWKAVVEAGGLMSFLGFKEA
jgi:3-isopropylmalate/(R)-2-methylmalate dehydratase small subunit